MAEVVVQMTGEHLKHLLGRQIALERQALDDECPGLGDIDVIATRPAEMAALGLGAPEPSNHAVPDEIPLELGDGRQDVKQEPAAGRRGVDRLVQHDQVDAKGLQIGRQRHEVARRTRQAGPA